MKGINIFYITVGCFGVFVGLFKNIPTIDCIMIAWGVWMIAFGILAKGEI